MAVDRKEDATEHYEVNKINQSSDPDAEDGYIETVHVTPANVSEMKEFANIAPQIQGKRRVFTDKGSASTANRQLLKDYGHKNGIMEKA